MGVYKDQQIGATCRSISDVKEVLITVLQAYLDSRQKITYPHLLLFNVDLLKQKVLLAQTLLENIKKPTSENLNDVIRSLLKEIDVAIKTNKNKETELSCFPHFNVGGQLGRDLIAMKELVNTINSLSPSQRNLMEWGQVLCSRNDAGVSLNDDGHMSDEDNDNPNSPHF